MSQINCALCLDEGGELIARNDLFRLVYANEPDYPGFVRLILNEHVSEMSDLSEQNQTRVMQAVFEIERILREYMAPQKMNLATLGNMVPHVHWHIIPRYMDDACFPGSVWSEKVRKTDALILQERAKLASQMDAALKKVCLE